MFKAANLIGEMRGDLIGSMCGITGAIVNRQPFGGMKKSAFGDDVKSYF